MNTWNPAGTDTADLNDLSDSAPNRTSPSYTENESQWTLRWHALFWKDLSGSSLRCQFIFTRTVTLRLFKRRQSPGSRLKMFSLTAEAMFEAFTWEMTHIKGVLFCFIFHVFLIRDSVSVSWHDSQDKVMILYLILGLGAAPQFILCLNNKF